MRSAKLLVSLVLLAACSSNGTGLNPLAARNDGGVEAPIDLRSSDAPAMLDAKPQNDATLAVDTQSPQLDTSPSPADTQVKLDTTPVADTRLPADTQVDTKPAADTMAPDTLALPALTLSPPIGLDFGSVVVNTKSPAKTITLTNTGTGPTGALNFGPTPVGFEYEPGVCYSASLDPGSSCVVTIKFAPAVEMNYRASLPLTTGIGKVNVIIGLTGTGVARVVSDAGTPDTMADTRPADTMVADTLAVDTLAADTTPPTPPKLVANPAAISAQDLAQSPNITITNVGGSDTRYIYPVLSGKVIDGLSLAFPSAGSMRKGCQNSTWLIPGESCEIQIVAGKRDSNVPLPYDGKLVVSDDLLPRVSTVTILLGGS